MLRGLIHQGLASYRGLAEFLPQYGELFWRHSARCWGFFGTHSLSLALHSNLKASLPGWLGPQRVTRFQSGAFI